MKQFKQLNCPLMNLLTSGFLFYNGIMGLKLSWLFAIDVV